MFCLIYPGQYFCVNFLSDMLMIRPTVFNQFSDKNGLNKGITVLMVRVENNDKVIIMLVSLRVCGIHTWADLHSPKNVFHKGTELHVYPTSR